MKKVYVKEEVCIGCKLCEVYCQFQHSDSDDLVKAFKREQPGALPRVRLEEDGHIAFSLRCQHCEDAPCASACLTGALTRDPETGAILHDENKCIGCWTCMLACPYGAIKQDTFHHRAVKCDLCQGEEIPACVANCPNEALVLVETPEKISRITSG